MTGVHTATADGIGRIELDNPPANVLTRALLASLREGLAELAVQPGLRAVLLSARGKHFSGGADVGEHLPPVHARLLPEFLDAVTRLWDFPVPVVAAVQGRCVGGGCELAIAADIVVAAEGAAFVLPEIGLGVLPPAACALLPRLVSRGVASEMVFTGDGLSAEEAGRVGLVRYVVPDAELEVEALALARRIARHSGAALRAAKRALRTVAGNPRDALRAAADIYLDDVMGTRDALEGLRAFVERRRPSWSDR